MASRRSHSRSRLGAALGDRAVEDQVGGGLEQVLDQRRQVHGTARRRLHQHVGGAGLAQGICEVGPVGQGQGEGVMNSKADRRSLQERRARP